jgi:hypothetical protein
MHEGILMRMREKIRTFQYIMTLHAEEEMEEDDLTISDVEECVLTGEIIDRGMLKRWNGSIWWEGTHLTRLKSS